MAILITRQQYSLTTHALVLFASLLAGCGGPKKLPKDETFYKQSLNATHQHQLSEALRLIDAAIARKPLPHYRAYKATLLYQQHSYQASIELFEQLLQNTSTPLAMRGDIMNNYACALNQMGQHEEAQHLWQQLTTQNDYLTPEVAWFNLGMRAVETREWTLAIQCFNRAILMVPDYVDALFYRATAQKELGQYSKSIASLRTLLSIVPSHAEARRVLAEAMRAARI